MNWSVMKFADLVLLSLLSLSSALVASVIPDRTALFILGVPTILFFPGYALVSVIWPEKTVSGMERIAVGVGFSILSSIVAALLVHSITGDIDSSAVIIMLCGLTLAGSGIAVIRRTKVPEGQQFALQICLELKFMKALTLRERAVSFALLCALIVSIVVTYFALLNPVGGERFTELYILDSDGQTLNYPIVLSPGQSSSVVIGLFCHEYTERTYTIMVGTEGSESTSYCATWDAVFTIASDAWICRTVTLSHEEGFEDEFFFQFSKAGTYNVVCRILMDGTFVGHEVNLWVVVQ